MTRKHIVGTLIGIAALLLVAVVATGHTSAGLAPAVSVAPALDIGPGFTYQGFLQDNGAPVNGACDFTFAIYDAASDGNQFGATDEQPGVLVNRGSFTVRVNIIAPFEEPVFNGAERWLELAVRCPADNGEYTTLAPRQPLTATPYALSLRPGAVISGTVPCGVFVCGSLNLTNASTNGLNVPSAGWHGVSVQSTGWDGVFVNSAGMTGVRVETAAQQGVYVGSAGGNGLLVGSAGFDGVRVINAGSPSATINSADPNGFDVAGAEGNGLHVGHADLAGVHVQSAGADGIFVNQAADLAAFFNGDVEITGACTGCTLAAFGVNGSDQPLLPGIIVSLQAAYAPVVDLAGVPIVMEVAPAASSQPVVGVVAGRAELNTGSENVDAHLVPREGPAAPGDYVTIIMYGLAQVQATAGEAAIVAGSGVTAGQNGAARLLQTRELDGIVVAEGAPSVGIALQELPAGEEGLIWVWVGK